MDKYQKLQNIDKSVIIGVCSLNNFTIKKIHKAIIFQCLRDFL